MRALTLLVLAAAFAPVPSIQAAPQNTADVQGEAQKAAESWLALLDNQKHEESYQQASASFKSLVTQEQWTQSLERARDRFGPLVSRDVSRFNFANQLRGAPDGDYAIFHFRTVFKNKEEVTERLTLIQEDGKWRMTAYGVY